MLKKRILALAVSLACAFSVMPMASLTAAAAADVTLGDLEDGAKQIAYVNFADIGSAEDLPDGVTITDAVTLEDGVASMSNGEIRFDRDTLLGDMQTNRTIIAEAVVKFNQLSSHRIVMSMGSDSGKPHLVMGMHTDQNIKCNDTKGPVGDLQTNVWLNLKYVVSDTGTWLYVDDSLEAENADDTMDISQIDGDFIFGHYTVSQWADAAFDGEVSEIRLSVADAATSTAQLSGVTLFGGTATVDEDNHTVDIQMLKNTNKSDITFNAAKGGTAVISDDGETVTVTSADGTNTVEYSVTYDEFESYTNTNNANSTWNASQITDTAELISQANFTNLDPTRAYVLTAKVAFDLTGVADDISDDTLVLGHSPCVYDVYDGADHETGWDGSGSWSIGIYKYYLTGGIYTLGMIKDLEPDDDGYVDLVTVISPTTFKYDASGMTSLKIQGRIEGLKNINAMYYMQSDENYDGPSIDENISAPEGITATFGGFTLTMLSNNTDIEVTVDGVTPTLSGDTLTAKVAQADIHNIEYAPVEATTKVEFDSAANKFTVTAEDGTVRVYTLVIDDGTTPSTPGTTTPGSTTTPTVTNGVAKLNGKTVLYANGKLVTGTKIVTVSGKTYAVVNGYVKTGKKQVVKIGSKYYVVNASGVVQKGSKNKLIKVGTKSYVVNKNGVVQRKASGNKLVKVGAKSYIVNKLGVVQKGSKNKLVKVGKKKYVVNKKGVVQKNKKSIKVGKKTYKTNKKGVATLKK